MNYWNRFPGWAHESTVWTAWRAVPSLLRTIYWPDWAISTHEAARGQWLLISEHVTAKVWGCCCRLKFSKLTAWLSAHRLMDGATFENKHMTLAQHGQKGGLNWFSKTISNFESSEWIQNFLREKYLGFGNYLQDTKLMTIYLTHLKYC